MEPCLTSENKLCILPRSKDLQIKKKKKRFIRGSKCNLNKKKSWWNEEKKYITINVKQKLLNHQLSRMHLLSFFSIIRKSHEFFWHRNLIMSYKQWFVFLQWNKHTLYLSMLVLNVIWEKKMGTLERLGILGETKRQLNVSK